MSDQTELQEQLDTLRAREAKLIEAVRTHAAEAAAARFLGDGEYGPLIADSIRASIDDTGAIKIQVIGQDGKARTRLDLKTSRFVAVSMEELAGEIKARWPRLNSTKQDGGSPEPAPPKKETDAELLARLRQEHGGIKPVVTAADIAKAKAANPWAKATENLTLQMKVVRYSSELAQQLKREAGVA